MNYTSKTLKTVKDKMIKNKLGQKVYDYNRNRTLAKQKKETSVTGQLKRAMETAEKRNKARRHGLGGDEDGGAMRSRAQETGVDKIGLSSEQRIGKGLSSKTSSEKKQDREERKENIKNNETPSEKADRMKKESIKLVASLHKKKEDRSKVRKKMDEALNPVNETATAEFYRDDNGYYVVRYNNENISLRKFLGKARSGDKDVNAILTDMKDLMKKEKFDGNLIQYIKKNFEKNKNPLDVIKKNNLDTKFNKD